MGLELQKSFKEVARGLFSSIFMAIIKRFLWKTSSRPMYEYI